MLQFFKDSFLFSGFFFDSFFVSQKDKNLFLFFGFL